MTASDPTAVSRRNRGQNGDPGSDGAGGPSFFALTQDCDPRHGDFKQVVEDPRIFASSIVFASIAEWQDYGPHYGASRWTINDVVPRKGAVDVAISNTWLTDLPFRVSLWVVNGFL